MAVKKTVKRKTKAPKKPGLFDIVENLNKGTNSPHLMEDDSTDNPYNKLYLTFTINRAMSQHPDTILLANALNQYPNIAPRMHYDFLRHTIRPRRRYGAWAKQKNTTEDIKLIMQKYNYSLAKAHEAITLFDEKSLAKLRKEMNHGGTRK